MLDQELNRLPEKYRAPLILCYLRGRTHDQAAEELRCPIGTVRSRLARGRDLLRKRLTRRGFAPTAAVLGTGPSLSARLLVEAVPPSLVSATVKAAFGFGSTQTIQAGAIAASVLVLAQGVLTTMKLAQFKWIGLAMLATALSAGGVVAVSHAAGQPQVATSVNSASFTFDPPQQAESAPTDEVADLTAKLKKTQTLQARERDVVNRIIRELQDLLDDRQVRTLPTPARDLPAPPTPARDLPAPDTDARRTTPTNTNTIGEMEVQLKLALLEFDYSEKLARKKGISMNEVELYRGKVFVIVARLEGLDEDLRDEIARLELELRRKHAEREKAEARTEVAQYPVARNKRLNERKPGMVAAEDVGKAEGEYKVATAGVRIVDAEIAEVGLRIEQLRRRRDHIKRVIPVGDRAKAVSPATGK